MLIGRRVTLCPYCEQGYVLRARIRATGMDIAICEECDTCWEIQRNLRVISFEDLMRREGLMALWSEIDVFAVQLSPVPYR